MKKIETYLTRAFIVSNIYLFAILLGIYILVGVFNIDESPPRMVVLFLKATSALAVLIVIASAVIIPGGKLIQKQRIRSPAAIAVTTLLFGLMLILLHALYVKLRTCPYIGSSEWYCQVEADSYLGMVILASFFSSLVGCIVWIGQKLNKKT